MSLKFNYSKVSINHWKFSLLPEAAYEIHTCMLLIINKQLYNHMLSIFFIKSFWTSFAFEKKKKMFQAALVVLFLLMSMPATYEARRILYGKEQNLTTKNQLLLGSLLHMQGQVPKISVSNPSNTSKSVYVAPSAPNRGTYIPSSTKRPLMSPSKSNGGTSSIP